MTRHHRLQGVFDRRPAPSRSALRRPLRPCIEELEPRFAPAVGLFDIVPVSGVAADQLIYTNRYYSAGSVPGEAYGLAEDVPTIAVGAQLVTRADLPDELIFQITAALWRPENEQLLHSGHVAAQRMHLEKAIEGVTIPLHPGAKRYYQEKGLLE